MPEKTEQFLDCIVKIKDGSADKEQEEKRERRLSRRDGAKDSEEVKLDEKDIIADAGAAGSLQSGPRPLESTTHLGEGHEHLPLSVDPTPTALSSDEEFEAHSYIGPSLAVGFGVMLLIDQLFQTHPHTHSSSHTHIVALTDFRALPTSASARPESSSPALGKSVAATIGLIVHAAADGIALGAASASNRASLELLVFIAIMLHKAPSAFGLATFLLDSGYSRKTVRQHLLAFSCSAPLGAIATYFALKSTDSGSQSQFDMNKWTGILLLFSAGTFLFVSTVHILPEITSRSHHGGPGDVMNGSALDRGPAAKGSKEQQKGGMSWGQVVVVILGIAVPYFLSGFHHGH